MEDERMREERVEYHVRHGAFWTIIWPRLKQFFKILGIFLIFAISYAVAGKYMLLGLLTAPIWLLYARRYLRGKATPVIVTDLANEEIKVYEVYSLKDWKLIHPYRMGGFLLADRIDVEKREIEGPPMRGLGGFDFIVNRELFLKLKEMYPRLMAELAEWKYGTKIRAQHELVRMLARFKMIEERGGEVESLIRKPVKIKRVVSGEEVEDEAGEQG